MAETAVTTPKMMNSTPAARWIVRTGNRRSNQRPARTASVATTTWATSDPAATASWVAAIGDDADGCELGEVPELGDADDQRRPADDPPGAVDRSKANVVGVFVAATEQDDPAEGEQCGNRQLRRQSRQVTDRLTHRDRKQRVERHRQCHSGDDRDGSAVSGGQHDRGEHRLVGKFGEEHHAEGDQEGLQYLWHQPASCWMRAACAAWLRNISPRSSCTTLPSRTMKRPLTIVCQADTGPQRSHASMGSASAPANVGPVNRHTAMSATAPWLDHAELTRSAEARCPSQGGAFERHASGPCGSAIAQLGQQHRLARFEPQRRTVGGRRPVDSEADGRTCGAQGDDRGYARRQDHVAAGAVRHTDAGGAQPCHFVDIGHHAVGHPRALLTPPGSLEVLHRTAPEPIEREGIVFGVLGEVGVQPHVESLGQFRRAHHQRLGDAERAARRQRDAHHRPQAAVVVPGDGRLTRRQDLVIVGHHVVGWQPSVLLAQRHRAAGRMKAHAEVGRRGDLRRQEVTCVARVQVQMIGGGRAAAERQLGEADERAGVHGLFVDGSPQRIQRLQPAEQRLVGHRRVGAGEVLEQVVMGVDEPGRDEALAGIDRLGRGGLRLGGTADRGDEATVDCHPAAGQLAAGTVEGRQQPRPADQQIGHASGQRVDDDPQIVDGCQRVDDAQP